MARLEPPRHALGQHGTVRRGARRGRRVRTTPGDHGRSRRVGLPGRLGQRGLAARARRPHRLVEPAPGRARRPPDRTSRRASGSSAVRCGSSAPAGWSRSATGGTRCCAAGALAILDERSGTVTDVDTDVADWSADLCVRDGVLFGTAHFADRKAAVASLDLATGELTELTPQPPPAGSRLPARGAQPHVHRPGRTGDPRLRLPAGQSRTSPAPRANCRRTWCTCTAGRPAAAAPPWTWTSPTSPAGASAWSRSTTAARPATAGVPRRPQGPVGRGRRGGLRGGRPGAGRRGHGRR